MFVCADAKKKIQKKARARFEDETIAGLLLEAERLEISRQELITMIKNA